MENPRTVIEIVDLTLLLMEKQGYAKNSIRHDRYVMEHLVRYAKSHGISEYSVKLTNDYLRDEYEYIDGKCQGRLTESSLHNQKRVLMMTRNVFFHGSLTHSITKERMPRSTFFRKVQKEYAESCDIDNRGPECIDQYLRVSCEFLCYLEDNNLLDFSELSNTIIDKFILSLQCYSKYTVRMKFRNFKSFLSYLYSKNYIEADYSYRIPRVTIYQKGHIPSTLSKDECQKLLKNIDKKAPTGMRDFAVILIAIQLGLRESDICNLKISDFNWDEKTLTIIQEKTSNSLTLPITDEIIAAIGNYMKNGRPKIKSPYIFLTHKAPYDKLRSLYATMTRALQSSDIKRDKEQSKGMHILRHTLASNLLEKGIPLSTISEVLGHRDYRSTEIYLHTDIEGLRNCAIELEEN